eukprot:NODE_5115_length_981_cov_88.530303_g4906_i0.p1 GENE.NODE_5115_length_981_cov_88.530303_g4906_i0~~NODE_5115_length_981_cov_88.530303_g4906_i0.p1  ORF type:complete len:256 (-),score=96.84 NODE_5115_length_981_cov_88.530303_g4906_i0:126-893(-)
MEEGEIDIGSDGEVEEEEEEVPQPQEEDPTKARMNRLFQLRMKLNKARSMNKAAVLDEFKREKDGDQVVDWKKKKEEYKARKEKEATDLADANLNPDKDYLNVTAAHADEKEKKKRKKAKDAAAFGWDIFNEDTQYNSYKKRTARLHEAHGAALKASYETRKVTDPAAEFFPDKDSLVVSGAITTTDEGGRDRIVAELDAVAARRTKFSRRRQFREGADVDYVNERNRVFNEKLKRSFDEHTVEIKQNLERGTAL